MRIVVDVDDVLADTFGALETRFGTATDPNTEDLKLMFPGTDVHSIHESVEFHLEIPPVDGAVDGVSWLLDAGHSVRYLSSRPQALQSATREWLIKWQFPKIPLQCLGREQKIAVLRSDPYDLLIDDMITYLSVAKGRGKLAIAFANPWNAAWNDSKIVSWSEIRKVI